MVCDKHRATFWKDRFMVKSFLKVKMKGKRCALRLGP